MSESLSNPDWSKLITGGVLLAAIIYVARLIFLGGEKSKMLTELDGKSKDHEKRLHDLSQLVWQVRKEGDAASAKLGGRVAVLEKQVNILEEEIRTMRGSK